MSYLTYSQVPTVEVNLPALEDHGVRLLVRREDLNHPLVSGNKWWKLKHNLMEARGCGFRTLLTFGGAFSNHIYATAAAGAELGFETIGVIRGEETQPLNPTLAFAREKRMRLHFVSRLEYRSKNTGAFLAALKEEYGEFFLIPEGGSNALAVKGCRELAAALVDAQSFDELFLPVGTGGTLAGLVSGMEDPRRVTGIAVLKNGSFLEEEIRRLLTEASADPRCSFRVLTDYHHGGYAKTTPALLAFMRDFQVRTGIPLDFVYTGKMMFAAIQEITRNNYRRGTTVLALHTGGLQAGAL